MDDKCRIDKWLWAVRLCKTRTVAADVVSTGKIKVDGESVKPSYHVFAGKVLTFRKGLVTYSYKVLGIIEKRVSAPVAVQYYEDITPEEELIKLKVNEQFPTAFREKGTGRPTKKERRDIDEWMNL
jgi:ribosome-associated heat shock protein Hsp15